MRLCAEVLCDWNGQRRYHRLPGTSVLMDAENVEQLQWLLQSLLASLQLFDGKYVSGPPPETPRMSPPPPGRISGPGFGAGNCSVKNWDSLLKFLKETGHSVIWSKTDAVGIQN